MEGWILVLYDLWAAWLAWAESILHDAAQLPYRVALLAFMVGAIMSWFAAREWYRPAIRTLKMLQARRVRPVSRNMVRAEERVAVMHGREVGA